MELGKAYSDAGADELVFLDITASFEERKTFTDMVTRVAAEINIPFTVGGGINALKDYYDRNGLPYDEKDFPDCAHCGHCD